MVDADAKSEDLRSIGTSLIAGAVLAVAIQGQTPSPRRLAAAAAVALVGYMLVSKQWTL